MKKAATLAVALLAASVFFNRAFGADDLMARTPVAPKTVEPERLPAGAREPAPKSPRLNPDGDKPINPDQPALTIRAIVLVKTRGEIQENGLPAAEGVQVNGIPLLEGPDFQRVMAPFIGQLMTENRIRDLEDAVILFCRNRGRLLVDVILPEQNIENGVLQLWFLEGKTGKVSVKNDCVKWFRDQFILDEARLRPGEPVDSAELTKNLDWLNNNPFRQVDAVFKPGEKLGLTDVELHVEDRLPLRPYLGYEDSGTRFTGPDRLLAGLNWGNAFGLDHQLNYQYSTDIDFRLIKAHSASYVAPLPWRHTLTFYGSYVDGRADFRSIGLNGTSAQGISWQTSARYSVPLPDISKYRHEISAGFDFKRSNNTLEAGGTNVLQKSDTDVAQFVAGYSGVLPDRWGRTSFDGEFYYSPGGLTPDNSDANFKLLRVNSAADYLYGRVNAERMTRLPGNFTWVLKGSAQAASDRLQPSEELAIGGYNTVRGYDERVVTGDDGWIIDNELRSPALPPGEWLRIPEWRDALQFLAFFDYASVRLIRATGADGARPNKTLSSVGGGLRYVVGRNFSLRFDYGYPLTETGINEHRSRVHIGALLSY